MSAGAYLASSPFCPRMAAPMASNTLDESTPVSSPLYSSMPGSPALVPSSADTAAAISRSL